MTVTSEINRAGPFFGDGAVTVFPFGFRVFHQDHLQVILFETATSVETVLTRGTHYTVSGVGAPSGGSITMLAAPTAGQNITILRRVPFIQDVDLENQGAYYAETIEEALDLAVMRDQQLQEQVSRSVKLPPGMGANDELTSALFGGILRLSESADEIDTVAGNIGSVETVSDHIAAIETVAQNIVPITGASQTVRGFATREALAAAILAGEIEQGKTVLAAGQPYLIDSAATGYDSALQDLGVNGVRRPDRLENLFLAAHFTTQDDPTINISASIDGVNFALLNSAVLPGGNGYVLDGRDPSICWFAGWWWIFITGNSAGSHDFALFRSRDLTNWSKHQIAMAGGPYASATVSMPGGSAPASAIWAPEPFIENGVMKVMISIRYGADFTNIYGATQQHFRPYVTTLTNLSTLAFSAPVPMVFGAGDHSLGGASRIDPSVVKHGGTYYCAIKDSYYRRIQVYSAAALEGPWTFIRTLGEGTREIEAPCLVRVRDRAGINGETARDKFRIYVDNNRTGPDDPSPNSLVGAPYYFEAIGSPANVFGAMQPMFFDGPVRHGSIINLSEYPAEAAASLSRVSAAGKSRRPAMLQQVGLTGGAAWIRPQQDVTYYVDANSGATDLTVRDGPADRFYLAVFSGQAAIGINVKTEAAVNRGFLVGFGYGNDSVIEMRRRGASGGYYPVGPIRRAEFRATRAGSAQTITGGADTVMAWTEEDFDLGGFFNLAGNAWVPPAGRVDLDAQIAVTNGEVGGALTIDILKNGTSVARGYVRGQDTFTARAVLRGEPVNGTDQFTVRVSASGSGSRTISGTRTLTRFYGICF